MSLWLASKESKEFLAAELINAGAWAVYPVATFLWTGNPYRLIAGFILALAGVPLTSLLMLAVQLSFMKKIHSTVGKIAGYAMPSLLAMTALELLPASHEQIEETRLRARDPENRSKDFTSSTAAAP